MPTDVEERIRSGNAGSAQLTDNYNKLYNEYHSSDVIDDFKNLLRSMDELFEKDILPILENEKNMYKLQKKLQQKILNWVVLVGEKSKRFFVNDKTTSIFTLGISASGTLLPTSGAAGVGIYVNPKNNNTFILSTALLLNGFTTNLALPIILCNIEQAGLYTQLEGGFGVWSASGSIAANAGIYTSLEDASGPYFNFGGSMTLGPSFGLDITTDIRDIDRITGTTFSAGLGAGVFGEAHARWGCSFFLPLVGVQDE